MCVCVCGIGAPPEKVTPRESEWRRQDTKWVGRSLRGAWAVTPPGWFEERLGALHRTSSNRL